MSFFWGIFFSLIFTNASWGTSCAQNKNQLKSLLSDVGVSHVWVNQLEGHWSKRVSGSGFNIVEFRNRWVIAVAPSFISSGDAQYFEICPSNIGNDFVVVGQLLGQTRNMEIKIQGKDIFVANGLARGTFKKRAKTKQQILEEFQQYLGKL